MYLVSRQLPELVFLVYVLANLRSGLEHLIRKLCGIPGIKTVDMTTNGWHLERKAEAIREAGRLQLSAVTRGARSLQHLG